MMDAIRAVLTALTITLPRRWREWRYARTTDPKLAQRLRRDD